MVIFFSFWLSIISSHLLDKTQRATLVPDLEQEFWAQDLVLCGSCNKGVVEIFRIENEFLYKNPEDLYTSFKKTKNYLKKPIDQVQPAGRRKKWKIEKKNQ